MSTRNVFVISFMVLYLLLSTLTCDANDVVSISKATYDRYDFGSICAKSNCSTICQKSDPNYTYGYQDVKVTLKNAVRILQSYEKKFVVCGIQSHGKIDASFCISGAKDPKQYYKWLYDAAPGPGELPTCYDAILYNI